MNIKITRTLTKLSSSGYDSEEKISAMSLENILSLPKITIDDVKNINILKSAIKEKKVITVIMQEPTLEKETEREEQNL